MIQKGVYGEYAPFFKIWVLQFIIIIIGEGT